MSSSKNWIIPIFPTYGILTREPHPHIALGEWRYPPYWLCLVLRTCRKKLQSLWVKLNSIEIFEIVYWNISGASIELIGNVHPSTPLKKKQRCGQLFFKKWQWKMNDFLVIQHCLGYFLNSAIQYDISSNYVGKCLSLFVLLYVDMASSSSNDFAS